MDAPIGRSRSFRIVRETYRFQKFLGGLFLSGVAVGTIIGWLL